jgi:hypothetical protein
MGDLKKKDGLLIMGDLHKWKKGKDGLIVMDDLPKRKKERVVSS